MAGALELRAHRARDAAGRLVACSERIVASRRLLADPETMVKRCAWCGRLALGRAWVLEDEVPAFAGGLFEKRTTDGICSHCFDRLQRDRSNGVSMHANRA
jgi:hypothetical protein